MEEILASIRRIISADETDEAQPAGEKASMAIGDDVFELTQEIRDDGAVVDIAAGETIHDREIPEPVQIEAAGTPFGDGGLVGPSASAALTAAFENLTHALAEKRFDRGVGGRTVEDVVKEVVRPIVKEWLDENLPEMVERLIGREIARMTRRVEDAADRQDHRQDR